MSDVIYKYKQANIKAEKERQELERITLGMHKKFAEAIKYVLHGVKSTNYENGIMFKVTYKENK